MNAEAAVSRGKDDLAVRMMGEREIPALVALYRLCFDAQASERYIRWRYLGTPGGTAPTVLVFDGGTCAASYAVWPVGMMLGGRPVKGAQSMDTMTHPDYRGRGLFTTLAEHSYLQLSQDGYEVLYGFPNDNSYPGFMRRLNWDHVRDIPHWVRPLCVAGTSGAARLLAAATLGWPRPPRGFRVEERAPALDEVADLAARRQEMKDCCRVAKNREWFAWRYHADSGRGYQWVAAYVGSELRAIAVWRLLTEGRRAYVCELVGDADGMRAALQAVLRAACREGARLVGALTSDPQVVPLLKSHGFIRQGGKRFIVRPLTGHVLPANIHQPEAWRITAGDTDYF